jgi:hypothetical protein
MNAPGKDIVNLDRLLPAGTIFVAECRGILETRLLETRSDRSGDWHEWTPGTFVHEEEQVGQTTGSGSAAAQPLGDPIPPSPNSRRIGSPQKAKRSARPKKPTTPSIVAAVDFLVRYSFIRATFKYSDSQNTPHPFTSTPETTCSLVIRIYLIPIDHPGFRSTILSRNPTLRSKENVSKSKRMLLHLFGFMDPSSNAWNGLALPTTTSDSSSPPSLYEIFNSLESPRPDQSVYERAEGDVSELLESSLSPKTLPGMKTVLYNYQRVS